MADAHEPDTLAAATAAFAEHINAGRQHASAEAFEAAREAYAQAIGVFVLHPQGYLERGSVRSILGDMMGAVDDLGVALALSEPGEDMLRAHFNRGTVLLDIRQAGRAVPHFERSAAAGVQGAERLLTRARREAGQEGFAPGKAAETCCARGFELLPRVPLVALACFEDARRLDPAGLWAIHGAGQANGAIGRPHHARKAFSEVLERGAQGVMRAEALFNRGSLLPPGSDGEAQQQAREDLAACLEMAQDPAVGFPSAGDPIELGAMVDAIRARLATASGSI